MGGTLKVQQPSPSAPSASHEAGQAASHSVAMRWMTYLKVHRLRGIPAMIDGYPQQLNFGASFKCHSRMECRLIKVLFNIYQTCGWCGFGDGGTALESFLGEIGTNVTASEGRKP